LEALLHLDLDVSVRLPEPRRSGWKQIISDHAVAQRMHGVTKCFLDEVRAAETELLEPEPAQPSPSRA
jgi:hypothetical protein